MPNEEVINSLEEFKALDQPTRDYFIYSKLKKLDDLDNVYASKWVEKVVVWAGSIMGSAILLSIISLVLIERK